MSRCFERISFNQFKKDVSNNKDLYESIKMPKRSTKKSAGYDICSIEKGTISPGSAMTFKTGLKVSMNDDEVLHIYSRSSMGYKNNISLANSVGVIDSDYNNIDNEGHFSIRLINLGDKEYTVNVGDKIAQGIFIKYLTVDNEEVIESDRSGGIGSTGK